MHIENPKLKYNQPIVTWKGLHQHPIRNLTAHRGAGMASCHGILLFDLSGLQEEFSIYEHEHSGPALHTPGPPSVETLWVYL
jgi:hypothetical protein